MIIKQINDKVSSYGSFFNKNDRESYIGGTRK